MSTQSIPLESLNTVDLQHIFASASYTDRTTAHVIPASAETEHSLDDYDSTEIRQIIGRIAVSVLTTDSDERLDFLISVNPALTENHLEQIVRTTELWLDDEAMNRIRAIARRCFDDQTNPQDMITEWNSSAEIEQLVALLSETSIPDKTLSMCYTISAAYDKLFAAYFIHGDRKSRRVDFSSVEQSAEEIAEDLRFVNFR